MKGEYRASNPRARASSSVWTDSKIVIDGFGSEYGGVHQVQEKDQVSLFVRNASTEFTIWTGAVVPGTPDPFDSRENEPQV